MHLTPGLGDQCQPGRLYLSTPMLYFTAGEVGRWTDTSALSLPTQALHPRPIAFLQRPDVRLRTQRTWIQSQSEQLTQPMTSVKFIKMMYTHVAQFGM